MTVRDGFAIFVLSNGRPEFLAQHTANALRADGYTGRWYIVLDDEDATRPEYEERFGADRIRLFHKDDTATDMGDNGGPRSTIVYARNAVDGIAAAEGLRWTLQLDDDYNWFGHRFAGGWQRGYDQVRPSLRGCITRRFDEVIEMYLDFLEETGALSVAFAQGGDFMGGVQKDRIRRKAMNSFFSRVGRPVNWLGRFNEDVNTYVVRGATGELFLTALDFALDQVSTQQAAGGMGDAYRQVGTYVKSFYTVIFAPSAVKVSVLGRLHDRIHHAVFWNYAVPKIISDRYRKPDRVSPAPMGARRGSILDVPPVDAVADYARRLANAGVPDVDAIIRVAQQTIEHVSRATNRPATAPLQELQAEWYASLAAGHADFSVYSDDRYLAEAWACWIAYSRRYLRDCRRKLFPTLLEVPRAVVDLGCGIGYSTAGLVDCFPGAEVVGTQLPGTSQEKIAKSLAVEYGFDVLPQPPGPPDLVFASEYFEHFPEPVAHLEEVLAVTRPRWLLVANTFTQESVGHFPEYRVNGSSLPGHRTAQAFGKALRRAGYEKRKSTIWNNRPTLWEKDRRRD